MSRAGILRRRTQLTGAEIFSSLVHRAQKRRPILEVSGEYLLNHQPGKLRYEMVEHYRRIPTLISQAGPVQIWGIPRFGEEPAGVSRERRHGRHIQQFETVIFEQGWDGACQNRATAASS